jgi:hypothetical protein
MNVRERNKEVMACQRIRKEAFDKFMKWCRETKPIEKAFFKALLAKK